VNASVTIARRILRRGVAVARWLRPRLPGPLVALALAASNPGMAAPEGGVISAGRGVIVRPDANTTVVRQRSSSLVADWQSFDVGAKEQVRFEQPAASAAVLNRIHDADPSRILGRVSANGRVFLANPNGMIFGRGAVVDVGALVATTLSIDDERFMRGDYTFGRGGSGTIVNQGTLRAADGGSVSLIADSVRNEGLIVANHGRVNLAAGGAAVLDFDGDGLIYFEVGPGEAADALREARNAGRIEATGGQVLMTARTASAVISSVVNNDGMIRADSVTDRGGRIVLEGDGQIDAGGTLVARGEAGGAVDVLGDTVVVRRGAVIDASGTTGGGTIHIGGNYQGKGPLRNARNTTVEAGSAIRADALERGDGGRVIVWSDDTTRVDGRISARGGPGGGDGGFVETSGKRILDFSVPVDVSAPAGAGGTWLLDPEDIVIDNAKATSIEATLNTGGNVSVQTSAEGDGEGNITVAASIEKTEGGDAALTLDAHNRIDVNAPIVSTAGKLDVNLLAGRKINVNNRIDTNAGSLDARITGVTSTSAEPSIEPGVAGVEDEGGADDVDAGTDSTAESGSSETQPADTTGGEPSVVSVDEGETATASVDSTTGGSDDLFAIEDDLSANDATASTDIVIEPPVIDDDIGIDVGGNIRSTGASIALDGGEGTTRISGALDVSNASGAGGTVDIAGDVIELDGATIDASGESGGSVRIGADEAGQPDGNTGTGVVVGEGTTIRADGRGAGDGGTVAVWSNDVTTHRGHVSARGGDAGGDGGFVEVSSRRQVNLHGGTFDVSAPQGADGTVLIDPVTLDITSDQLLPGGNLVLQADERVTVDKNVVISTREIGAGNDHLNDLSVADSGNLTITSQLIEIGKDAQLLTFADNGFADGDILLDAAASNDSLGETADGVVTSSAGIFLDGAVVRGGRVEFRAVAQSSALYDHGTIYSSSDEYADVTNRLAARLGHGFGTAEIIGGVSVAGAAATIDVIDSQVIAGGELVVDAAATASATVRPLNEALSLAYAESNATARVNVEGSTLAAGTDVTLSSSTTNTTVSATNALSGQVTRPVSPGTGNALVTLAVSDTIADTETVVDAASTINAPGTVMVKATSTKTVATLSAANAFRNGTIGQSTALSFADIDTLARIDGAVTAGDLDLTASTTTVATNTGALAGFKGTAGSKQDYQDVSGQLNAFFVDQTLQHTLGISLATAIPDVGSLFSNAYQNLSPQFQNAFGTSLPSTNTFNQQVVNPVTQQIQNRVYRALVWELPGSSAFSEHTNETNAIIGADAVIKVDNDVDVTAAMLDDGVQNFSHSNVQLYDSSFYSTNPNQQSDVTSVAILATIHDNDANAVIEGGAVVDAGAALNVIATTDLPNDGIIWPTLDPLDNAIERLGNIDLSLQNIANVGSQLGDVFDMFAQELRDEGDILAGLVTTSAKSRAGTKDRRFGSDDLIGIAGSANLIKIENNAVARIGDGAMINQDLAYRTADQDVTVDAFAALDTVNLSGNIGVIPPPSGTGTADPDSNKGKFLGVDKSVRDTNGAGSSLLGLRFYNGAVAEIGNGVMLHADDLVVDSSSEISNLSASVASGTGERYGIKGSFLGTDILVNAQSKIDDGAMVNATGVTATAASLMPRNLNVAVGEINERSPQGTPTQRRDDRWAAAVVDNLLTRNVDAFVGNRPGESVDVGSLDAGAVNLMSTSTGLIEGYSLAVDRTAGPTIFGDRPRQQLRYNNRHLYRQGRGTNFGIRASIDVSRNTIEDDTSAYVDGGVTITATGDVLLQATSDSDIAAFAGAATLMSDRNGTETQRGIAGAYSENTIGANTRAFVEGATIASAPSLTLDANTLSTISGIAAGGALTNSTDAIVGSVVYNTIGDAPDLLGIAPVIPQYGTSAYLRDATIDVTGLVSINASDTSTIDAIAGAFAKSNTGGYGGAVAINAIGNRVDALNDRSSVDTDGALSLVAVNDATIESFAAAIALGNEDAFAGGVGWNDIANITRARIVDGKDAGVDVEAGSISLSAVDHSFIDSFVGALGNSKNQAIGVSVAINEMANLTEAGIANTVAAASGIDITAKNGEEDDENTIDTFAVALANAGGDEVAVSVAVNEIDNTTRAFLTDDAEIRNTALVDILELDLDAQTHSLVDLLSVSIGNSNASSGNQNTPVNQNPTQHFTPGGTSGFGIDISANVALNTIVDNTLTFIDGGSEVDITGPVALNALSNSAIKTTTGAVQRTTGNTGGSGDVFGVAGVFSMNELGGETAAFIDASTVSTDSTLDLDASRFGSVEAFALGWKSGSRIGLAGAATFNNVYTSTGAAIRNQADVDALGAVGLTAIDMVDLGTFAGALSFDATEGGVGAGISINEVAREVRAVVDNSDVSAAGLDLHARTGGEVNAWAISVERAPIGLSGTLTFNRFNDTTEAVIRDGRGARQTVVDGDATLSTVNTVNAFSLSGAGAIRKQRSGGGGGLTAAVGVAAAYNESGDGNRTRAAIENATVVTNPAVASDQSIELRARTDGTFESVAISGAINGDITIAGAAVINQLAGLTEAVIDNSTVSASHNVILQADNLLDVNSLAPVLAFTQGGQSKNFGFGGAVTVNLLDTRTRARIEDSNGAVDGFTSVDALGAGTLPYAVYDGELDAGGRTLEPIEGVGVVASSLIDVENVNATLSVSDDIALGGAVSVNLVNDAVEAAVMPGVAVNQSVGTPDEDQSLVVVAGNHHRVDSIDGAAALAQADAAVGAAVDYTRFAKSTEATIEDALAQARQRVAVRARADETLTTAVIGGALGQGTAGIAGSVSIAEFASTTRAAIRGGVVSTPGQLAVDARDRSSTGLFAGGFRIGDNTVGVGGSLIYVDSANTTEAFIEDGAIVDATGLLAIDAASVQDLTTTAVAGSAGGDLSIAGAVGIKYLNSSTVAGVRGGAQVNQDTAFDGPARDVEIDAQSDVLVDGVATGIQLGGDLGVGAGVEVNLLNDTVQATVEDDADDTVVDGRDIGVKATSRKDVGSVAIAGNASQSVALSGSVAVTSVASGVNQDVADAIGALDVFGPLAQSPLQAPSLPGIAPVTTAVNNTLSNNKPVAPLVGTSVPVPVSGTVARIGANADVSALRNLLVEAALESDNDLVAGDISLSDKGAIGAGVSFLTLRDSTRADIAGADDVDAGNDVTVKARESAVNSKTTTLGDDQHSTVAGFSGGAANVRLGGGVVYVDKANNTLATIADTGLNSLDALDGSINVLAQSAGLINSTAVGVTVTGNDISGAVIINNLHNLTEARVVRSTLRADDNLLVFADNANGLELAAVKASVPSGVELGGALTTAISDNETRAYIDDDADVWAGGNGNAMTIDDGGIGAPVVLAPIGEVDLDKVAGDPSTEDIYGVGVVATSVNNIDHVTVSGSAGGSVGVAASVAASFIDDTVESYLGSAALGGVQVNDPAVGLPVGEIREVRVVAGNHTATNTLAGEASLGGNAGIGGAVNLVSFAKETRAYIENADGVRAENDIGVNAVSSEQQSSVAVAGEIGPPSLAGAAGIIVLDNLTEAYIAESTVRTPGNLSVNARDEAEFDLLTGGATLTSDLGVGVGLNIIELTSETRAWITGVDGTNHAVDAGGLLEVGASSFNDIVDIAMAGSVSGSVAIAGGISVKTIETITEAYLDENVRLNQDAGWRSGFQHVSVEADDDLLVRGAAGAVAAAQQGASIGAGIDIVVANDRVSAGTLVGADIDAGGDVNITATAEKSVSSLAIGASLNEFVSVSGAVSSVVLGSGQQQNTADAVAVLLDEFNNGVDTIASDYLVNPIRDQIGLTQTAQSASGRTPNLSNLSRHLKTGGSAPADSLTVATVGAESLVDAGGDIVVNATNHTDVSAIAGTGALGALSVGAGVAVISAGNDVEASAGGGATLKAGEGIDIRAEYLGARYEILTLPFPHVVYPLAGPLNPGFDLLSGAYGGSAGGLDVQISLAHVQVDPLLDAFGAAGSLLDATQSVSVATDYHIDQKADAVAAALAAIDGAGADARSFSSPDAKARLESDAGAKIRKRRHHRQFHRGFEQGHAHRRRCRRGQHLVHRCQGRGRSARACLRERRRIHQRGRRGEHRFAREPRHPRHRRGRCRQRRRVDRDLQGDGRRRRGFQGLRRWHGRSHRGVGQRRDYRGRERPRGIGLRADRGHPAGHHRTRRGRRFGNGLCNRELRAGSVRIRKRRCEGRQRRREHT
jgi:trimeric autotransporter adhesin